jgi:hypothetical protein
MAGSDSRFDAATFRTNIRFAMDMGLPVDPSERPTFHWKTIRTYTHEDSASNPFSWESTPATETTFPDVQVSCAVTFGKGSEAEVNTNVGEINATSAVLTVLDEDYALLTVDGVRANQVSLGGDLYEIEYVAPPTGLFDVTVYEIYCQAVDES